jgi:transglutaminase-like putative cysteine protease
MIGRIGRTLLSVEVLGPVLTLLSLQTLTFGISSSLIGTEAVFLFMICVTAAMLGWALSKSKIKVIYSLFLLAGLGVLGIWIAGARLVLPLLELLISIGRVVPQVIPAIQAEIPLDTSLVQDSWAAVLQSSSALAMRWQVWLASFGMDVKVNDALIRNMIWSFAMWCLGAWTGWFAARRNAILALLPGIGLMAIVLSYSEHMVFSLWWMVILMLLLMGIWNYRNHTIQWERHRVDYSDSIVYDNAQAVILMALLVGTLAFSIPSISWREIRDAIRVRNENRAAEILGIREQSVPTSKDRVQKPSLPREHLLTEGVEQSQELVMTIRTGELPPAPSFAAKAPRHYWRSTVYDEYKGTGWLTSYVAPVGYTANTPIIPGLLDGYRPLHLDVKLHQPEGRLFWSGLLYSATVPFRADWRVRPQSDLFADQTALLQADIFAAVSGTHAYESDSYIPLATIEDLRAASTEYPEELRDRYLRLPKDLPPRIHRLAGEITAGIENPYDKAKAIERYLRTNYPYDLNVPAPPQDQDVVDYFLFDLKRGYCDYYATAMVVLARASGLPARFVSGYSPGSYDAPNAQYVVRRLNAHSWSEIYFPEIGWIEFEPTASEPEIERIEKLMESPGADAPASSTEKFIFTLTNTGILYWMSPIALALVFLVLYFTVFERVWILSRSPASAVALLYWRYYRIGRPLAGARTRAETALEFTSKLVRKMDEINSQSRVARPFRSEAQQLTNTYLLSLFSNHSLNRTDVKKSYEVWKRMRRQLWAARLKNFTMRGKTGSPH